MASAIDSSPAPPSSQCFNLEQQRRRQAWWHQIWINLRKGLEAFKTGKP